MPYDVKRLNAIYQGEAEISDRDAVVEIVSAMVETMVRGHRRASPSLEERYRTQLRTLREVMSRLAVDLELPNSLRRWAADQPPNVPALLVRQAAEEAFEPLLERFADLDAGPDGGRAHYAEARKFDNESSNPSDIKQAAESVEIMGSVDDSASIFISYSHADKELAQVLYDGLKARGQKVWIDDQELRIGDSLIERISTAISEIDFFLALVSPATAQSHWCQKELALAVSGELNRKGMRVMPLRVDDAEMPAALTDQLYLPVSLDAVDGAIDRILRDIASYRAEAESTLAAAETRELVRSDEETAPDDEDASFEPARSEFEPLRILGVVEEGVGMPLNDDSRGSALYRVPLQLSREPSEIWAELFQKNWDDPPRFTLMHRPGIGSVEGDTIVLDGTSMDELEKVHLDTLRAVIEKTNAQVAEIERRERETEDRENQQRRSHEKDIRDVSRRLRFD